jgi:hypothetical protein
VCTGEPVLCLSKMCLRVKSLLFADLNSGKPDGKLESDLIELCMA